MKPPNTVRSHTDRWSFHSHRSALSRPSAPCRPAPQPRWVSRQIVGWLTALAVVAGPALAFSPPSPEACFADDWATPPELVRGLALVHGTSAQTPHSAYWSYWTEPMVESLRLGLSESANLKTVGCDFEQVFWHDDMADCLVEQLTDFIDTYEVNDLVINTHSHGGNAVRWVLSNPTLDPSYADLIENIRTVTAIAPSSRGTPLADMAISGTQFQQWLGQKFNFDNDATAQQQTHQMAYYNALFLHGTPGRPMLPVGFYSLIGTDVTRKDPKCADNKTVFQLRLTHMLVGNADSWCNDGFLTCHSQEEAGFPWSWDIEYSNGGRELNHDVSRRNCFGLDLLLRDQLVED